jgi:hypothetical protein
LSSLFDLSRFGTSSSSLSRSSLTFHTAAYGSSDNNNRVDTVVEQAACTLTTNNKAFCQFSFYFIYSIKGNNFNTMSEDGEPKPEVAEPITIRVRDQVRVVATIVFNSLHMIL